MSESDGNPGSARQFSPDQHAQLKETLKKRAAELKDGFMRYASLYMKIEQQETGVTLLVPNRTLEIVLKLQVSFQNNEMHMNVTQLRGYSSERTLMQRFEHELTNTHMSRSIYPIVGLVDGQDEAQFTMVVPREVQDTHAWFQNNMRHCMQAAMVATWAEDPVFSHNVLKGCFIEPPPRKRQPDPDVVHPRFRPVDFSHLAGLSDARNVRQRQESARPSPSDAYMGAGPIPGVQIMQEPMGDEQQAVPVIQPAPAVARDPLVVVKTRACGNPFRAGDGWDFENATPSYADYEHMMNSKFMQCQTIDECLNTWLIIRKLDKQRYADDVMDKNGHVNKHLTKNQTSRTTYMLSFMNELWERTKTKEEIQSFKYHPQPNLLEGQIDRAQTMQEVLHKILFPESRKFSLTHGFIDTIAKKLYPKLRDAALAVERSWHQDYVLFSLFHELDILKEKIPEMIQEEVEVNTDDGGRVLCHRFIVFAYAKESNGAIITLQLDLHQDPINFKMKLCDAKTFTFSVDRRLPRDEISRLRDTLISNLEKDVPKYDSMMLEIMATSKSTTVTVMMHKFVRTHLLAKIVLSTLVTFVAHCLHAPDELYAGRLTLFPKPVVDLSMPLDEQEGDEVAKPKRKQSAKGKGKERAKDRAADAGDGSGAMPAIVLPNDWMPGEGSSSGAGDAPADDGRGYLTEDDNEDA